MKAILLHEFGTPEQLYLGEYKTPQLGANEILVKVKATALNRADTLQRKGLYPPPKGESPIIGLEMSGVVVELGTDVTRWTLGDKVCGLLAGGGYAEYVKIHEEVAMPIPNNLDFIQAAALPEVFLTAFQTIDWLAHLQSGERILIHAGASGVGTAAIQLAKQKGAEVIVTASESKQDICKTLGADKTINYKNEDFKEAVLDYTNGEGVDVVIDFIAAPYFHRNIDLLRADGRLILLAWMGGGKVDEVNLQQILLKRLHIMGSTLRARTIDYKIKLAQDLMRFAWPLFENGKLKPVVDSVFDWAKVAEAHRYMEANKNKGKIILKVS